MALQEELEYLLVSRLGIAQDSHKLLVAAPVARAVNNGIFGTEKEVAEKIVNAAIDQLPLEIKNGGEKAIAVYFSHLNGDGLETLLRQAVTTLRKF